MPQYAIPVEEGGKPRLKLVWENDNMNRPEHIHVFFDGEEVATGLDYILLEDGREIDLPDGSKLNLRWVTGRPGHFEMERDGIALPFEILRRFKGEGIKRNKTPLVFFFSYVGINILFRFFFDTHELNIPEPSNLIAFLGLSVVFFLMYFKGLKTIKISITISVVTMGTAYYLAAKNGLEAKNDLLPIFSTFFFFLLFFSLRLWSVSGLEDRTWYKPVNDRKSD